MSTISQAFDLFLQVMQSQMIGMQSSLDRILLAVQTQQPNAAMSQQQSLYSTGANSSRDAQGYIPQHRNGFDMSSGLPRSFPSLPGFAPPVSIFITMNDMLIHFRYSRINTRRMGLFPVLPRRQKMNRKTPYRDLH
jgi:hypothetical protein